LNQTPEGTPADPARAATTEAAQGDSPNDVARPPAGAPQLSGGAAQPPEGEEQSPRGELPAGSFASRDERETFALGERFGAGLAGGEILLLDGPLGAGKTVFVKGLAAGLRIDVDEVTSPSFTLVNRYDGGRLTLYHLDLYRLPEGAAAAHAVDLEELLADERAVVVIEWAGRMGAYPLPAPVWRVSLAGDGDDPRSISVSKDV
jgi:tRNA threonylcarbamoyladenosine biosynthesis protein TsaE